MAEKEPTKDTKAFARKASDAKPKGFMAEAQRRRITGGPRHETG